MKIYNPLFIVLSLFLTVAMVSCTTTQYASDEQYETERVRSNRIYIDDPYRGTVVLERDPVTGRYYDVTNGYGYNYGSRYNTSYNYDRYPQSRYGYTDRVYSTQRPQQPATEDKNSKAREEARRKVLGN